MRMRKKTVSLFVSLVLICSLILPGTALAADEYTVKNSGFEEAFEGEKIPGWYRSASDKPIAAGLSYGIVSENSYEGKNHLEMKDETKGAALFLYSDAIAVTPGESLNLSAYFSNVSGSVQMHLRYYPQKGFSPTATGFVESPSVKIGATGGDWKEFSLATTVPEGAAEARILLVTFKVSTGAASVDQISLKKGTGGSASSGEKEPSSNSLKGAVNIKDVKKAQQLPNQIEPIVEELGTKIHSAPVSRSVFGYDKEGNLLAFSAITGDPVQLMITDVVTEEMIQVPVEDTNAGKKATLIRGMAIDNGVLYLAGTPSAMFSYTPGDTAVKYFVDLPGAQTFDMDNGPDGILIAGSYNKCEGFEFNTKTLEVKNYGTIKPGQQYLYNLAYDKKRDTIYWGTGSTGYIIAMDRKTGNKTEIPLHPKVSETKFIWDLTVVGDKLFMRYSPGDGAVYDLEKKQYEEVQTAVRSRHVSEKSPDQNRVYYTTDTNIGYYDLDTNTIHDDANALTRGYATGFAFTKLDEEGFTDTTLVGITRQARLFKYNTVTGKIKVVERKINAVPLEIQTMGMMNNGKLHLTAFLNGGNADMDPVTYETSEYTVEALGDGQKMPQCDQVQAYKDKLFLTSYPNAKIWIYDTAKPWDVKNENPKQVYEGFSFGEQDRGMTALAVEEAGVFLMGTVPKYGKHGGSLVVYDVESGKADTYQNIVPNHSITALAYKDGIVYAGSNIYGGLGNGPASGEAQLIAFDLKTRKIVSQWTPVLGAKMITELIFSPDGKLWGAADGALFEFDVLNQEVLYTGLMTDYLYGHIWGDAQFTIGKDNKLYAMQGRVIYQFDFETKQQAVLRKNPGKSNIAQDPYGNFFVSDRTKLYKYSIPGVSTNPSASGIKVEINGQRIDFGSDQGPVLAEATNRTLVPMRKLFEVLGAEISWSDETETVTAKKGDTVITIKIGDPIAKKNGADILLDQPAKLINDRTMVPVRFVAEALGATVDWEEATQTVKIIG